MTTREFQRWLTILLLVAGLGAPAPRIASAAPGSVTYVYDDAGRLRTATYQNGTTKTYTLDAAGNRTAVTAAADTTAPSVPSSVQATPVSQTQVNLTWGASTDSGAGLGGYRVYRNGTQVGTTNASTVSYSDTGLSGFTTYTYTITAFDLATPANVSAASTAVNARTLDQSAPSVPAGLSATGVSQSQVNLSWSASTDSGGSGVAGYRVYRGGVQVGTTASNVTTYSDTGLSSFTTYSYTVAAFDAATPANASAQSGAVSGKTLDQTAPGIPSGLSATAASQTQINLSWSASTDSGGAGLAGYRVYRAGVQIGTTASNVTTYSDTGLSGFTTYSYTVAAFDAATPLNLSAQSTAASARTLDQTAPGVPTGLSATAASQSQINLSWSATSDSGGSGLAGYRVYRGGVQVGTTASNVTTYSDTGLAGFTTYSYTVAAYDAASPVNVSAQSGAASARTLDQSAPSTPAGLSATAASQSQINLSWSASTDTGGAGMAGYRVYRDGTQVGTTGSSVTTYSDTGLAGFTTYSYTVVAFDAATPQNSSAQSGAALAKTLDQTAPGIPSGLSASAASESTINLSWSPTSDSGGAGLLGYRIFRNGSVVGTASSASFTDSGLAAYTTYSYTVDAYDAASPTNYSAQSGGASARTLDLTPPSTPSLSATAASSSQINLSWSASSDSASGVAGYVLYRNGTPIQTTASTSFSDTGLAAGTAYNYSVNAYDNASPANYSAAGTASATTPAATTTESAVIQSERVRIGTSQTYHFGYYQNETGSISPLSLTGGVLKYYIFGDSQNLTAGTKAANLAIRGFTADPGKDWLISATANGVTLLGPAADVYTYTASTGTASWLWRPTPFNFPTGGSVPVQLVHP